MLKRLLFVVLLALASVAQAAVYSLPWGPKPQFVDANGAPMSNGTLSTFAAGSTTPQVTYTDSTGSVANATSITLNTRGETPNEVWLTGGLTYKFVLKDSSGSTIWAIDNIAGVNDVAVSLDEWKASGQTPTYVSATSFTMAGDQTVEFHVGRRLKSTNSGGTVYSTITTSAYAALTTITVVNDSGNLDAGLSAVSLGVTRANNKSIPPFDTVVYLTSVAGTNTITASASKSAAPLATGQQFVFIPAGTNTGATTLNVNSLGAKNIFAGNSALVGGELHASIPVKVVYDGTQFQLQGPVFKQPTRTVLTSGSGTYTTPTGATRLEIRMVGGGSGGGGGNQGVASTVGGDTTFGSLTAHGGAGAVSGGGGTATPATATGCDVGISGAIGGGSTTGVSGASSAPGGMGGVSPFGGAGSGFYNAAGTAASANSGSGGGGGGVNTNNVAVGIGGSAGAYCEKLIVTPAATYSYGVGAGGAGASAGANGFAGAAGGSGIIDVKEFYNFKAANDERWLDCVGVAANDACYRLRAY